MAIQLHDEYGVGWYLFELMIGQDMWNRVHGVVYPDGTIRDPAIVAAIGGFYRNRGPEAVRAEVNQEDYTERAVFYAEQALRATRQSGGPDHSEDPAILLEACEFAANLLEAGELVPMNLPPTARIEAYRRQEHPDCGEIRDFLTELIDILRKKTHVFRDSDGFRELRK